MSSMGGMIVPRPAEPMTLVESSRMPELEPKESLRYPAVTLRRASIVVRWLSVGRSLASSSSKARVTVEAITDHLQPCPPRSAARPPQCLLGDGGKDSGCDAKRQVHRAPEFGTLELPLRRVHRALFQPTSFVADRPERRIQTVVRRRHARSSFA